MDMGPLSLSVFSPELPHELELKMLASSDS